MQLKWLNNASDCGLGERGIKPADYITNVMLSAITA
jgi:hypothetical protein